MRLLSSVPRLRNFPSVLNLLVIFSVRAFGFEPADHAAITERALRQVGAGFLPTAIVEIKNANACVDLGTAFLNDGADFQKPCVPPAILRVCWECLAKFPERHFDDESFVASSVQLRKLRDAFVLYSRQGDYIEARKVLGMALHALQDFYSHSNWVELGNSAIFDQVLTLDSYTGRGDSSDLPLLAGDMAVCSGRGVLLKLATRVLTSGYWFKDDDWVKVGAPRGKCAHGTFVRDGIAKDSSDTDLHWKAVTLAELHSGEFVRECLRLIAGTRGAKEGVFGILKIAGNEYNKLVDVEVGDIYVFDVDPRRLNLKVTWGFNGFLLLEPMSSGPGGTPGIDGNTYTWYDSPPLPTANVGALIGSIFPRNCPPVDLRCKALYTFPVGMQGYSTAMSASGTIYLYINDANLGNNRGYFEVTFTMLKKARSLP